MIFPGDLQIIKHQRILNPTNIYQSKIWLLSKNIKANNPNI